MTESISKRDARIRITTVQEALRNYLSVLPIDSRLSLISFNSGISSEKEIILRGDAERQTADRWVNGLAAEARRNGDTHLWSTLRRALQIASEYSKQAAEQTVMVRVLTDGQDTERRLTLDQVLAEFPDVDGKAIRANLVLLGDLEIPLRVVRNGFEIVRDTRWEMLFPPIVQWAPQPVRINQDVSFFDNSQSPYTFYDWRIDGVAAGAQKSVTKRFTTAGEHAVALVVTGTGGAKESAAVRVTVLEAEKPEPMVPNFIFSPAAPEPGQTVKFLGRSSGKPAGYVWQINGQEVATTMDMERLFPQEGAFEIKFIVRDADGNKVEKSQTLTVTESTVVVAFKVTPDAVSGQSVQFVNESSGRLKDFAWEFGDGQKSSEKNPVHPFRNETTAPVKFAVTLRATTVMGKSLEAQPASITIHPLTKIPPPRAAFQVMGDRLKVGTQIQFRNESAGADSFAWSFDKDGVSTNQHPEFHFETPGTKIVQLKVHGPGGDAITSQTLTILKPSLSIAVNWLDAEDKSCPPPKQVAFGDIPPQHVRSQQYLRPPYDTFEMVLPDELPADGGAVITLEGKSAEACEVVRIIAGGEKTFPVTGLVRESGRFRVVLKASAGEGELPGNIVIQPQGNDVLLNQHAKPITVPVQLRIGSPGWGVGLAFLLLSMTGAGLFLWRVLKGQPLRYPLMVTLREISPEAKGQRTDDKAASRPCQEFELVRIAEKIDLGKDGSSGGKTFDMNAPGFFLMGQRKCLSLHSRSGGQPRLIKNSDEINVTDASGRIRRIKVEVRPKLPAKMAPHNPKK